MKVYDLEGNEFDKEPVDVKECVQILGWSTSKPEPKEEVKPEKAKKQAAE